MGNIAFKMGDANSKVVLQYPGGKYTARKILETYIPKETKTLCSPFFGGGSFETYLNTKHNITIEGSDKFDHLVNFWQCAIQSGAKIAELAEQYYPAETTRFKTVRQYLRETTPETLDYDAAAQFYFINKASFSGLTLSPVGMSGKRFSLSGIEKLRSFTIQNLTVEHKDCNDAILSTKCDMVYADPPYPIEKQNLYGRYGDMHELFDHRQLAETLHQFNKPFVLSYNNHPEIRELYADMYIHEEFWAYGINHGRNVEPELVITNFDVAQTATLEIK